MSYIYGDTGATPIPHEPLGSHGNLVTSLHRAAQTAGSYIHAFLNQNNLNCVLNRTFTKPALAENPFRTIVNSDVHPGGILIPSALIDLDLLRDRGPLGEEFNYPAEDEDFKLRLRLVESATNTASTAGFSSAEIYLRRVRDYYEKNSGEIEPFIMASLEERKRLFDEGKVTTPNGVFLVHIGTGGQAMRYAPWLQIVMNRFGEAGMKTMLRLLLETPSFLMKREIYDFDKLGKMTFETIHAGLIPAFLDLKKSEMVNATGKAITGVKAGETIVKEGVLYSTLIRGAQVVGLGGLIGKFTKSGVLAQELIDVTKFGVVRLIEQGKITEEEVTKYLPHFLRAVVTTGHRGTIDAMVNHYEAYLQYSKKRDGVVAVYGGAGLIGSSFASLMKADKCRKLILVDPKFENGERIAEIQKELNHTGIIVECYTPEQFINQKKASEVDALTIATESNGKKYDDDKVVPGFREYVLELLKDDACVIDDNHPYCLSSKAIKRLLERGILYTGVGVAIQAKSIEVSRGRLYNLDKPVPSRIVEILYGCKGELMMVAAALSKNIIKHGFIGKASVEGVEELKDIQQRLGSFGNVIFHNRETIIKLKRK